jgi:serine protease Do
MIRFLAAAIAAGALCLRADDSPALDLARQLNNAFIEVAEKVSPCVVVIDVAQPEQAIDLDPDNPLWDMVPQEYRQRMQEEREKRREQRKQPTNRPPDFNGRGSGIIISADGYILTNFHVVEEAEAIRVRFLDRRHALTATVRGVDPQSDLAVIKVNATNLPVAKLGDSANLRVGEFAVAIGAPFELDYSVTYGHVSAKGRSHVVPALGPNSLGASTDQDFIQTDASINPGNSGGPLVNLYGEVIGINTLIRGLHTGIGFAIPINLARDVSARLIKDGKFVRSWLGVGIRDFRDDDQFMQRLPNLQDGVVVTGLQPGGPASKSDLKSGDVITTVDGRPVATSTQLKSEVRVKPPGANVVLDVVRLDKKNYAHKLKINVQPEAWPEPVTKLAARKSKSTNTSELGFVAKPITSELRSKFKFAEIDGVVVTEVASEGLASAQLRAGDVIVGVNHQPVKSLDEFKAAVENADLSTGLLLDIRNGTMKRTETLRRPHD